MAWIMIGAEFLREVVETAILTGRVKSCDPVSLILIAAPESGKTSVVLSKNCKAVEAFADVTGRGIHQILKEKRDITHIVINDMVATLSHKQSVNRYTMSQLNAITEEGITSISTPFGIEKFEIGKRGVITSLTLDLVRDSRFWWNKIGFTSRMLPFCYIYPEPLIVKIKNLIDDAATEGNGMMKQEKLKEFAVPPKQIDVEYAPRFTKDVRYLADCRSYFLKEQGMRRLKQYHAMCQGHALLRERRSPTVNADDVAFIKHLDKFVSYDTPAAL